MLGSTLLSMQRDKCDYIIFTEDDLLDNYLIQLVNIKNLICKCYYTADFEKNTCSNTYHDYHLIY